MQDKVHVSTSATRAEREIGTSRLDLGGEIRGWAIIDHPSCADLGHGQKISRPTTFLAAFPWPALNNLR